MSSASPLHITVVYSRSSRGRRRSGRYIGSASAAAALLRLGLLNLLVAGALYYGTWWRVDPVLLVKILVHTEFRGVGSDDLIEQLIPDRHSPRRAGAGRTDPATPKSQPTLPAATPLTRPEHTPSSTANSSRLATCKIASPM